MKERFDKCRWWLIVVLVLSGWAAGCDPKANYQNKHRGLRLETTISSDGKVVAVLDDIGGENARIRVKWLERNEAWQEYPAPKYANSIRFGLTGHQLLIAHARPGPQGASQLSRWDVSQPATPSEILYEGHRVAFPVEVKPGQFLVRICPQPPGENACPNSRGLVWALIEERKATPIADTKYEEVTRYGQPNVTPEGIFWVIQTRDFDGKNWTSSYEKLFAYALPGGQAPQLDLSRFEGGAENLECDRSVKRCAKTYLTDERIGGWTYVYGIRLFEASKACVVEGIKGYADQITLTPDGKSAVFSIARTADEPRHIVVLRFKPGQCQPTSIQTLHFEEQ